MKYNLVLFTALFCVLLPLSAQAGDFVGLVGIPGIEPTGDTDLNVYINALYRLSISLAALLAVIKIVAAGAKYMLSDIVPAKEEAKKDIQGALIGLLIVIGAIIILNTVNSDLTELDLSIDTTTIPQGPTIQEVIALQQRAFEVAVADSQSEIQEVSCGIYTSWVEVSDVNRCRKECRDLRGVFNFGIIQHSCSFSTAQAASCDPNTNFICCESLNGGDWTESQIAGTGTCSGITEARAASKLACGRAGKVWDDAGNYCRTVSCNINTNENCCSATGGTIQNNICTVPNIGQGTTELDRNFCRQQGNTWTEPSGPCVPNNTRTVVPGSNFPVPPYAADLDPNIPRELVQLNTACRDGGPYYEYSAVLNQCVIYQ